MLAVSGINFKSNIETPLMQKNNPSFSGIHIQSNVRESIVDAFMQSPHREAISQNYDVKVSEFSSWVWSETFLDLKIKRLNSNPIIRFLQEKLPSKSYTMSIRTRDLFNDFIGSFEDQVKALSPQKIEEFIREKELKAAKEEAAELKRENFNKDNSSAKTKSKISGNLIEQRLNVLSQVNANKATPISDAVLIAFLQTGLPNKDIAKLIEGEIKFGNTTEVGLIQSAKNLTVKLTKDGELNEQFANINVQKLTQ